MPWLRTRRLALGARPTEASTLKQAETRQREAAAEPGPSVVVGWGSAAHETETDAVQRCMRGQGAFPKGDGVGAPVLLSLGESASS